MKCKDCKKFLWAIYNTYGYCIIDGKSTKIDTLYTKKVCDKWEHGYHSEEYIY